MKSDGTELVLLKVSDLPQAFAVVAAANNDGVSIATRKRQRILFAKTCLLYTSPSPRDS